MATTLVLIVMLGQHPHLVVAPPLSEDPAVRLAYMKDSLRARIDSRPPLGPRCPRRALRRAFDHRTIGVRSNVPGDRGESCRGIVSRLARHNTSVS